MTITWLPGMDRYKRSKFLIITADDFGLHESVNEAVEAATREGVLTAASLMIAAPAAADAIRRARALPRLRVGLHLVLADGIAMLPHTSIPGLTDERGYMDSRMLSKGVRFIASRRIRRELEAEIRAQFGAFAASGLALDHVNVHKHFHMHPTLLSMILRIGGEYGLSAVRVPAEPSWFAARQSGWSARIGAAAWKPMTALMKRRLDARDIFHNDTIFGIAASGAMDERTLLEIVARLPPGVTEIYLHPAVQQQALTATMSHYRHADELAALQSARLRAAISAAHVGRGGFSDARHAAIATRGRRPDS